MSFSGAVLILAVTVIRTAAIHRLPKRTFLILWGLVLLRLFLPFSIPQPFSVYTLFHPRPTASVLPDSVIPAAPRQTPYFPRQGAVPPQAGPLQTLPVWSIAWCAGMCLAGLIFTLAYLRCLAEFRTALPVHNEYASQWVKEHPLKRRVSVKLHDRISAPLTYGIFRPVILMPKNMDWTDFRQLQYVLMHEYVHISRFDTAAKLIMVIALCVHWFNPMVWIMYILFNRDIELACDEGVIRQLGETSKSAYSRMLISLAEKRSGLLPLCSNFSKNAIEERITAVMKIKKTSIAAIVTAALLIAGTAAVFATSAVDENRKKGSVSLSGYSDEETEKLLALQFDGYETMSVSEYQNKVWQLTDTPEYNSLLENFSQDTALYEQKDGNEIASFLFYTLDPLTSEKWRTRDFGGYASTDFPGASDNASLEFNFTLTIQNADILTVGEYNAARTGITNGMRGVLQGKTKEELRNKDFMQEAVHTEIESLKKIWSSDCLDLSVEYSYIPLSEPEAENGGQKSVISEQEARDYPYASEEDYQSIFSLKTADYQNRTIADFNMDLLEWANEDYERMERIYCDAGYHDFSVALSNDEFSFITQSIWFSGFENGEFVRSSYTGRDEEEPSIGQYLPEKTTERAANGANAWCDLYYQFSWRIADKKAITVGERDRSICNLMDEIRNFWNDTDIEQILKMSKEDTVKKLQEIAAKCSTNKIVFTIRGDSVSFEKMDERSIF